METRFHGVISIAACVATAVSMSILIAAAQSAPSEDDTAQSLKTASSSPTCQPMALQSLIQTLLDYSGDIWSRSTLTGVNDADYAPPFPLTAKLEKLTVKVDRPKLSEEDVKKLETAMQKTR